jgi:lycopene elongase/hydratase (dihydrobisanhydrobacterioruberin-forming)
VTVPNRGASLEASDKPEREHTADELMQLERARAHNAWRRAGYRVMGNGFSYLLHLRPREWPIMIGHTSLGFLLAVGFGSLRDARGWTTLLLALVAWVMCLNGGTLAINSAFDRDTGDVGYLDAPPPVPRGLAPFSVALMAAGVGLALWLPRPFLWAYLVCVAMSVAYSVPPLRLKAVAGADWLINMVGFGTLTPYAGWAATGRPLTPAAMWALTGFIPLFASLYPLTQLYQLDEDRARGDRTLALVIGVRASLQVALVAALLGFACFARAGMLADLPRRGWMALAIALTAWLMVLVPWWLAEPTRTMAQRKRGMYQALAAWAVTDIAMLVGFAP